MNVLSSAYMPHLYCYLGSTSLAWTHAIADTLIGLARVVISATLGYLMHRGRSESPFHGLFFALAVFIVACGSSHLVEAITLSCQTSVSVGLIKADAGQIEEVLVESLGQCARRNAGWGPDSHRDKHSIPLNGQIVSRTRARHRRKGEAHGCVESSRH
jgi:hypothetical protein